MELLLLVFLGFLSVRGEEVQAPEEVQSPHIDPKLLGGRKTDVSIYPYQLSLQYLGLHCCGASLIDSKWALTAAHCLDKTFTPFLSVRAGATGKENGGLVYNVKNKYVHDKYDAEAIDYDMALLELDEVVDPDYAETIPLPPKGLNVEEGDMGTVTGWGSTTEDGAMVYSLRVVEIPVLKQKDCKRVIGRYLTDRMFCAGYLKGGKDTCQGDSGGPFIVNGMQMGIVSWGFGCGKPRKPGLYTNVSLLRDFIRDVAGL